MAGPFVACVRVGGEEVRSCLSDTPLDVLRGCCPVRSPGVYQRQRHMPGRWFSTTAGCFLEYESLLERDWMLPMDFDREVEGICEQPLRLRYSKDGKPASHVPDLLVWRGGAPELCDVKSASRVDDPEFLTQVRAMELACAEAGVGYQVLSEPDRQMLVNVRWLAGFRELPVDPDGERSRMLSVLAVDQSTISELLWGAREPVLARPVLIHLRQEQGQASRQEGQDPREGKKQGESPYQEQEHRRSEWQREEGQVELSLGVHGGQATPCDCAGHRAVAAPDAAQAQPAAGLARLVPFCELSG